MGKIKTLLTTAAVMASATFSLTMLASAAAIPTASTEAIGLIKPFYTETVYDGNLEILTRTFTDHSKYATFVISAGTSSITGNVAYTGNYKTAQVLLQNGEKYSRKFNCGTMNPVKTDEASLGGGVKAETASFTSTIYNGSDSTADIITGYSINARKT